MHISAPSLIAREALIPGTYIGSRRFRSPLSLPRAHLTPVYRRVRTTRLVARRLIFSFSLSPDRHYGATLCASHLTNRLNSSKRTAMEDIKPLHRAERASATTARRRMTNARRACRLRYFNGMCCVRTSESRLRCSSAYPKSMLCARVA